jgi:hypothetical protein
MSWDETAVLVAIKGHQPWYKTEAGKMVVADDGSNTWIKDPSTQHYLVEALPSSTVEQLINKLIMHQPRRTIK